MRNEMLLFFASLCTVFAAPLPKQTLPQTQQDSIVKWVDRAMNDPDLSDEARKALVDQAYKSNQQYRLANRKAKNLSHISLVYKRLGDTLQFRTTNKELIALSQKIGDKVAWGEAHWDMGDYFYTAQPDSAFYHYKEAHSQFSAADLGEKTSYPGRMLLAMARVKENSKDYMGAEKHIIAAIAAFKKIDAKERLFNAYNELGIVQQGMKKYDKALEYYNKAEEYLPFITAANREKRQFDLKNNIASVYLFRGDYRKAFAQYRELETKANASGNESFLALKVYNSLAISGFRSGLLSAAQALSLLEKSNTGLHTYNNIYDRARNQQYAAEILHAEGETEKAIIKAKEARAIAEQTGNNDRLLEVLKLLSQIDVANGAQHSKAYFELSDSLQLQERSIQDKFARIQLETDEIIEQNAALAERTRQLVIFIVSLLILALSLSIIFILRARNRKLRFKQKQQEADQEIYGLMLAQHGKMEEGKKSEQKRVSEELHDGVLGQMLGIRLVLSVLNDQTDEESLLQRTELIGKLQDVEEEIRSISHELSNAAYKKVYNYILSVKDLTETVSRSAKLNITLEHDEDVEWDDDLRNDIKINSYRILQELLQNCVKHAECKNVAVILQNRENSLILSVKDDGIGFDDTKLKKGIGLKNISSRMKRLHATWKVSSKPKKGTKVVITIPLIDTTNDQSTKSQASDETMQK